MSLTQLRSRGILDGTITAGDFASGVGGKVLQVIQTVKTDIFSTSTTSFTDITGLSVSITPSSASNKILVLMDVKLGTASNVGNQVRLMRSSTAIYIGDADSTRQRSTYTTGDDPNDQFILQGVGIFLDSPNTTSATTYKVQMLSEPTPNTGTVHLNRSGEDPNTTDGGRTASSITVMEIAV